MSTLIRCLIGPRLLRLNLKAGSKAMDYQPPTAERWGDTVISSVSITARLLLYVSPIVIPWAINRGWATTDGLVWMIKFLAGVGVVVAGAVIVRTIGRVSSSDYVRFSSVYAKAVRNYTDLNKQVLAQYDFSFTSWPSLGWPVDYNVQQDNG